MKRTLGIIFTLLMIMVAFVACEMVEEGDPLPPQENTETTPVGTVTIEKKMEGDTEKTTYCEGSPIMAAHFSITLQESEGSSTTASLQHKDIVLQYSLNGTSGWVSITIPETKYPKAGDLWIKAYHKDKPDLGQTIQITVYASQASGSSAE